jgi:hypothetical protein
MILRRTLTAVLASAALVGGGAALLAPSPADAATQAVSAADSGKGLSAADKTQLRDTGHVTVTRTTKKGKTVTVQVQRGTITALSATSVTIRSKDGYTHAYAIGKKTKVRGMGVAATGERAQVIAVGDHARRLRHGFRQAS